MLKFKKEEADDIIKLLPYLNEYNFKLGVYTAGWKIIWFAFPNVSFTIDNDCYIQYVTYDNQKYFYYPLSLNHDEKQEIKALKAIANYCYENKIKLNFIYVPKNKVQIIISLFYANCQISQDRKWMNYSYNIDDFIQLKGNNFAKQRNNIRKFTKLDLEYEFQPIDKNNINEAKQYIVDWWKSYDVNKLDRFSKYAIDREPLILDHYFQYGFVGAILKINKKIVALCVAEKAGNTLFNHVEKIDHSIKGLDCFFTNLFANYYKADEIKYINREDDVGIKGLRKSKLQYHPEELVSGFVINVNNEFYEISKPETLKINEHLVLKDITKNDTAYYDLCADDELNKYYGYNYHEFFDKESNGRVVTLDWFLQSRQIDLDEHVEISWGIFVDSKLIGEVSLFDVNYSHEAWIGFRTLKNEQRKGYTSKSVAKIISYGLYELGFDTLYSKCYKENIASFSLLKKVGMRLYKEDEKFYYFKISSK